MNACIVSWFIKINQCTKFSSGVVIGIASDETADTSDQKKLYMKHVIQDI